MIIKEKLFELRDEEYAAFQAKLTPNIKATIPYIELKRFVEY